MTPVHQYEPHDAPDPMGRDLSIATILGALCILGAYAAVCWGLDAVRWVLG